MGMVEESIDAQERVRCAWVWLRHPMAPVALALARLTAVVLVATFLGFCLLGIIISTPLPAAAESSASGLLTDGSPEAVVVVGSSGVIASWGGGVRTGNRIS